MFIMFFAVTQVVLSLWYIHHFIKYSFFLLLIPTLNDAFYLIYHMISCTVGR